MFSLCNRFYLFFMISYENSILSKNVMDRFPSFPMTLCSGRCESPGAAGEERREGPAGGFCGDGLSVGETPLLVLLTSLLVMISL